MIEIRERDLGGVTILDVTGRMVLADGPSDELLKETMARLLARDHRDVIVNLAEVSQMDTSGLTALVAAYKIAAGRGGTLCFATPTKRVRELFRITRLNTVFETYETTEDAIASLTRESAPAS